MLQLNYTSLFRITKDKLINQYICYNLIPIISLISINIVNNTRRFDYLTIVNIICDHS